MIVLKLNDLEIGYIAGILDGEGSISLKRQAGRRSLAPFIQITNSSKVLMDWIKERVGGYIYPHSCMYRDGSTNRRDAWVWQLRKKEDVAQFLNQIKPCLVIKQRHAELLLEFIKVHWSEGANPKDWTKYPEDIMKKEIEIFSEMWGLNSRGKNLRKFPILQEKDFGPVKRCRECNNPIGKAKRINSRKPDETLCCVCNKKKFGYYHPRRKHE